MRGVLEQQGRCHGGPVFQGRFDFIRKDRLAAQYPMLISKREPNQLKVFLLDPLGNIFGRRPLGFCPQVVLVNERVHCFKHIAH